MALYQGRAYNFPMFEFVSESTSPGVASVTSLTPTTIKVTFDYPAVGNVALRSPVNYVISPILAIYSVTPEAVTNPTYVVLTIAEQKTGENYDATLLRIEAA